MDILDAENRESMTELMLQAQAGCNTQQFDIDRYVDIRQGYLDQGQKWTCESVLFSQTAGGDSYGYQAASL